MADDTMDPLEQLRKSLDGAEPDALHEMVQHVAEGLMGAEADARRGACP